MAKSLTIEVPDELAASAEREGLWDSAKIADLMMAEIRRRAFDRLKDMMEKLHNCGVPPLTEEEVQAVVNEVRAERRAERARRT